MPNDPSTNDPKQVWKNQPEEPSQMTLDEIRRRVQSLHGKTRRELIHNITVTTILVLLCLFGIGRASDPWQQAGYGAATIWALAGLFFLNRGMWDEQAGATPGIDLYRREIERRRSLLQRVIRWSFGPTILAIAAFVLPKPIAAIGAQGVNQNAVPFLVLLASWIVAYFYKKRQGHQCLQREIDELNRLENQR
jgi:hypothetical protein